jgi:uncharacterized protein YndB with AHSA1/START domain
VRFEITRDTVASAALLWAALVDVEAWPVWMTSYTSVRRVDGGPLTVGSQAEVKQPGFSGAIYEVTALTPGKAFTWSTTTAGVRTTARHLVLAEDEHARVKLGVEQSGVLSAPVGLLLGGKIRRFLHVEAAGLCAAAEAGLREGRSG